MRIDSPVWQRLLVRLVVLGALGAVLVLFLSRLRYQWEWQVAWKYREQFLAGLERTLLLSLGAMAIGLAVGAAAVLMRLSRLEPVHYLAVCYVELVRGTPLLVQLMISYHCLFPQVGIEDPQVVGVLALGLFNGAYVAEILRAGIDAVPKGQWEAAHALGLSRLQTLGRVIAPQALKQVIPPLTGQFVSLVKDSSLLSIISVLELTKMADLLRARTFKVFESLLPLAALYLAITYPLSWLSARLERRLAKSGTA